MLNPSIWGKTFSLPSILGDSKEVYYPLIGHLLDTSIVMGILWDNWLNDNLKIVIQNDLGPQSRDILKLLAGIHDIGKCSPIFQGQLLSTKGSRDDIQKTLTNDGFSFPLINGRNAYRARLLHRHEKIGAYFLTKNRSGNFNGEAQLDSKSNETWIDLAVLGHHGSYELSYGKKPSSYQILEQMIGEEWIQEEKNIVSYVEHACDINLSDLFEIKTVTDPTILILTGMIVLADRIASTPESVQDGYQKIQSGKISIEKPSLWSNERSEHLTKLAQENLGFPEQLSKSDILGEFEPRGIQAHIPEERGLWLCMTPTGSGKTEAALLRHSLHQERLLFLLPTLSTTNAMMKRVENIYKTKHATPAVLAHGLAYLEEFYQSRDISECGLHPTEFQKIRGARLSAVINIATIDQLLLGSFPSKWLALKWVLIANAHVIIDEAHLLDEYQIELFKPLLSFLGMVKANVTILSATLPTWLQTELIQQYSHGITLARASIPDAEFPSSLVLDTSQRIKVFKDIPIEEYEVGLDKESTIDTVKSHIDWTIQTHNKYPKARLGVFVNTIKDAQNIAKTLQQKLPHTTVICLHSRMLAKHRTQITDNLIKLLNTKIGKAENIIVVGTQVIEMSLDIDLDLISSDLCPAPSLIQRLGRAWRDKNSQERKNRIPGADFSIHLVILKNIEEWNNRPYKASILNRANGFLSQCSTLQIPKDVQEFVETTTYQEQSIENNATLLTEERADQIYKHLTGNQAALRIKSLEEAYNTKEALCFSDYEQFTEDSGITVEQNTRYEEEYIVVPYTLCSNDKNLQKIGALDPTAPNTETKELKAATIMIPERLAKDLQKAKCIHKNDDWSISGPLPDWVVYDEVIGLVEIGKP